MAVFSDPFGALANFQQALDAFRASSWLDAGPSGGGAYPPMNVFRKGDDYIIIAEIPGVKKSDLDVQVKGRTLRLSGVKAVAYAEKAAVHRRERLAGRFDRAVTMPVEINPDGVKAEYRDGVLALFLPRAESEKPKSIKVALHDQTTEPEGGDDGREQGNGGPREEGARGQSREDGPGSILHSGR